MCEKISYTFEIETYKKNKNEQYWIVLGIS